MKRNFNKNKKVIVAMSGGVDSSVAAVLLKEQGYDLIGITMQIWEAKKTYGGCCSIDAVEDARKVADKIGIPHYTLNFRHEFKKQVIDNFIEEYKNGRTPNPCIRCNQFIKFDHLLKKAKELNADFIATGHYARIAEKKNEYKLLTGKDQKKDQSYVLYRMDQNTLMHTLFPLGGLIKTEVREIAKKYHLAVAEKAESQEICFIEDDDYARFLKEKYPDSVKPGLILNVEGQVVGKHMGIVFYTIGQRKGIGAHAGKPKYVIDIIPEKNIIIIGDNEQSLGSQLMAEEVSYVSGQVPSKPIKIMAKIRYNSQAAEAKLFPLEKNMAEVEFIVPQRAITPGQSVVFYLPAGRHGKKDEVLGGGIIKSQNK